jgi:hypothetical protein
MVFRDSDVRIDIFCTSFSVSQQGTTPISVTARDESTIGEECEISHRLEEMVPRPK